jgi:hypothetical protein
LGVFGVVRPRINGAFTDYVGGFQRDRWITNPVKTLRALLANPEAPRLVIALNEEKDGVMRGLRSGWANGRLLGLS